MKTHETETTTRTVVKEVYCDRCNKQIWFSPVVEGVSLGFYGEYGSRHDGRHFEVDLCDDCVDELIVWGNLKVEDYRVR